MVELQLAGGLVRHHELAHLPVEAEFLKQEMRPGEAKLAGG